VCVAVRHIEIEELPEELQESLDAFRDADENYKSVVEQVKEEHPDLVAAVNDAHVTRDAFLVSLKTQLTEFVKSVARDDVNVGRCTFGGFQCTPTRTRKWDIEAFQDMAEELEVYQQCIDERIIIQVEEGHVNVAKAREAGILQDLIDQGIIVLTISYDVAGERAEQILSGRVFEALKGAAWQETLKTVACSTPAPSTSI